MDCKLLKYIATYTQQEAEEADKVEAASELAVGSWRDFEVALIGPIQANSSAAPIGTPENPWSTMLLKMIICLGVYSDQDAIRERGHQMACGWRNPNLSLASATIWVTSGVYATYTRVIYGFPARLCLPPITSVTSLFVFIFFTLSFLSCFRFHAILRLILKIFLGSFSCTVDHVPDWQPRSIILGLVGARSASSVKNIQTHTYAHTYSINTHTNTHTHRDGNEGGSEDSGGDGNGDENNGNGNEDRIGEGRRQAKKRKKPQNSSRRHVGNGGDLAVKRENVEKKGLVQ